MKKILVVIAFSISSKAFSQSLWNKAVKSVYAMYGFHFTTKYSATSGNNNLLGRKTPFSLEAGLNLDYPIKENFGFRTGISAHLHFLNETTYGINGPFPPTIDPVYAGPYSRGIDYIELFNVGIPLKFNFSSRLGDKYNIVFSGGPFVNFYFPAQNNMAGSTYQNLIGGFTRAYWVTRNFNNDRNGKSVGISYPQLELDADITIKRKFKYLGLIGLGIKGHIGTQRLENATFVIWPTEPGFKSEGKFRLNRSYFGFFASYTFGHKS